MAGPPWCLLNGNYYTSAEPPTETSSFPVTRVLTRSHMLCVPCTHFLAPLVFSPMYIFIHELAVFLPYRFTQHQLTGLVPAFTGHGAESPHFLMSLSCSHA